MWALLFLFYSTNHHLCIWGTTSKNLPTWFQVSQKPLKYVIIISINPHIGWQGKCTRICCLYSESCCKVDNWFRPFSIALWNCYLSRYARVKVKPSVLKRRGTFLRENNSHGMLSDLYLALETYQLIIVYLSYLSMLIKGFVRSDWQVYNIFILSEPLNIKTTFCKDIVKKILSIFALKR